MDVNKIYTPSSVASKEQLITEIDSSFNKLQSYLNSFPEDQCHVKIIGTYNLIEVIFHLAEWESFATESLKRITDGTIVARRLNIKKLNEMFITKNKGKDLIEARKKLLESHKLLLQTLKKFDANFLADPDPYYPDKHTVYTLIQHCSSLHYPWAIKGLRKRS